MNILFINCKFGMLNIIDCGAANRTTMFVQALTQIGHVDVISFYHDKITSNIPHCDIIYSENVPYGPVPNTFFYKVVKKLKQLFMPYNPLAYYRVNKKREDVVDYQYTKKHYDIVACRYIDDAISCGLMKYANHLVVDVDDNLVNAFKRDMTNMKFRYPWSKILAMWQAYSLGIMSKWFLKRIRCSFYSNIVEPPYKKSVFLHNVTILKGQVTEITENTPKRILVVGWLDYFPNRNGVLHFVDKVFPLIKSTISDVELHVVGKCNDDKLLCQLNSITGVKALGFVENVTEEYKNCRVVIVPIYQGAGSSVKFVEGLMMKRPMVSTPMGVRGFDNICSEGVHYLLARTDEQFAKNIIVLLESANMATKMAQAAYEIGDTFFSQERFCKILSETIIKATSPQK